MGQVIYLTTIMEEKNNAHHFNIGDVDHENFYMVVWWPSFHKLDQLMVLN